MSRHLTFTHKGDPTAKAYLEARTNLKATGNVARLPQAPTPAPAPGHGAKAAIEELIATITANKSQADQELTRIEELRAESAKCAKQLETLNRALADF